MYIIVQKQLKCEAHLIIMVEPTNKEIIKSINLSNKCVLLGSVCMEANGAFIKYYIKWLLALVAYLRLAGKCVLILYTLYKIALLRATFQCFDVGVFFSRAAALVLYIVYTARK